MFERFTVKARDVVTLAQEEARSLGADFIRTEHLLAAMLARGEGKAYDVLTGAGLTVESVRTAIVRRAARPGQLSEADAEALRTVGIDLDAVVASLEQSFGPVPEAAGSRPKTRGHTPFTRRSKKVLELSLREALALKHSYIGTEHLLLGLIRENDGFGMQIIRDAGIDPIALRFAVIAATPPGTSARRRWPTSLGEAVHCVMDIASAEARRTNRRHIGTGHILFGLASAGTEPDAAPGSKAVVKLLVGRGLGAELIRGAAEVFGTDETGPAFRPTSSGGDHLTRDAKTALLKSVSIAHDEGRGQSAPEFVLLALAMVPDSTAGRLLRSVGLTADEIRARLFGDGSARAA